MSEKFIFPSRFKQKYGNAVFYAESFPEETRSKLSILRDLEATNNVDYIVCAIVKETETDGGFWITSDGFFLSKKHHILAMCEINNNNLKTE